MYLANGANLDNDDQKLKVKKVRPSCPLKQNIVGNRQSAQTPTPLLKRLELENKGKTLIFK